MATTYSPSLLDKLLGDADERKGGVLPRFSVERVKASVARDIEHVLNTHASWSAEELVGLPLTAKTLLTLGLVDVTSMSMASDRDRARIADSIRDALARHDSRLTQLDVRIRQDKSAAGGLAFSIRGTLMLQPGTEPVAFDAVLHPGSQRYAVSNSDNRGTL